MSYVPEFKPHTPRSAEEQSAWMRMDRDARRATGTGAFFTDTVTREDYPGDPAMWDRLRAMDVRLKALQSAGRPQPVESTPIPRGRIPVTATVGYLRMLGDLDATTATAAARGWLDAGGSGSTGMLMVGKVGTGKTSIACAVAVEFGYTEAFWPVRDLLEALRAADFDGSDPLAGRRFRDTMSARSLLVVDDVGVERGTDYERDFLRSLLETRCARPVATVVTTNLGRQERDAYFGPRVSSRLAEWTQVAVLGPDRRR